MTVRKFDRLKMLTISHNRFLLKTIPSLLFQKQLHHGAAFFALSFETKGFQQGDNKHLNYTQIAHTSYVELISDIWFGKWQEIIEQTQTLFFPTMAHLKKKKKTKQNNKPLSFPTKHQPTSPPRELSLQSPSFFPILCNVTTFPSSVD